MECRTHLVLLLETICEFQNNLIHSTPGYCLGFSVVVREEKMRGDGEGAGYGMQYIPGFIVRNYLCVPKQFHSLNGSVWSASTPVLTKGLLVCYERTGGGGLANV